MRVNVLLPLPYNAKGIGYTCVALAAHIQGDGVQVKVFTPLVRRGNDHPVLRMTLPDLCRRFPYLSGIGRFSVESSFRAAVKRGEIAYLWSEVSLRLARSLREQGALVVREKTNCHKAEAIRIAEEAYGRLGWSSTDRPTESDLAKEVEELDLCDYVFSPSPQVRRTLLAAGIDDRKIIKSSYGWDPDRLAGTDQKLAEVDGTTFLFVGFSSVLKGLPWLLDVWKQAGIRGRLVLAGTIAADVQEHFGDLLRRDDVVSLGYVSDIGSVYRSADVFVFPSLVEGGPQVTYEAMGCGLPVVVSPMGAGAVARHGVDGFVCDPMDRDAWAQALSVLAEDQQLREEMGREARIRAAEFTWRRVGERRRRELMRLGANPTS